MASTLLDTESEANEAEEPVESHTSEPEESSEPPATDADGQPDGDPPADSEDDEAPQTDSEEDQEGDDSSASKDEESSFDSLTLGEDSPLTEEHVEGIIEFAVANDLSPEAAQAILSRDEARAAAADDTWNATVERWETDFRADKEFGGKNLDRSVANARAAMAKFGPPGFIEALNASGFGNNPDLLRFAANVGARMAETDKIINGSAAPGDGKPTWNTLFPESGVPPSERTV